MCRPKYSKLNSFQAMKKRVTEAHEKLKGIRQKPRWPSDLCEDGSDRTSCYRPLLKQRSVDLLICWEDLITQQKCAHSTKMRRLRMAVVHDSKVRCWNVKRSHCRWTAHCHRRAWSEASWDATGCGSISYSVQESPWEITPAWMHQDHFGASCELWIWWFFIEILCG